MKCYVEMKFKYVMHQKTVKKVANVIAVNLY